MNTFVRLSFALLIIGGLVLTVPTIPVLADCDTGSSSDDVIVCDTDPSNPDTTQVVAGDGEDSITVEEGAAVDVSGGTFNNAIDGGADADVYNIAGEVNASDGDVNIAIADTITPTLSLSNSGDDTYNVASTGEVVAYDGYVNVGILDVSGDDAYNTSGFVAAGEGYVNLAIVDVLGDDTYNNSGGITAAYGEANISILDVVGDDTYNNTGIIDAYSGAVNIGIVDIYGDDTITNDGEIFAGNDPDYDDPAYVNFGILDVLGNDTINNHGTITAAYGYVNAGVVSVDVDPIYVLDLVYGTPVLPASGPAITPSDYCLAIVITSTPCSDDVYVNNGSIAASNGYVNLGIIDGLGNDSYTNNGSIAVSNGYVNLGITDIAGSNEITNNGDIVASDGYLNVGVATISLDELLGGISSPTFTCIDPCAEPIYGSDVVVNNGNIVAENGGINVGIFTGPGGDLVILNDGSYTAGDLAVVAGIGSDTVILGSAGVSYNTQCADFSVTTVDNQGGAKVDGLLYGDGILPDIDESDTLVLSLTTANSADVEALAAELAALDPEDDTFTLGDNTYNWAGFENLVVSGNIFTEGATKLYDDGVVLGFATADGLAVCDGPKGLLAGKISFHDLDNGQRDFSANGLLVHLEDLGGGQFKVHLLDGGVEQINDADENGVADSTFVFGR